MKFSFCAPSLKERIAPRSSAMREKTELGFTSSGSTERYPRQRTK